MTKASSAPNALLWLVVSLVVIALDQWTKVIASTSLVEGVPDPVVPGFLNWTLSFNPGAAFSLFADAGGWQRWGLGGIAIVISTVLVVVLARTERNDWRSALPLALIIGGALGNLIDRVRFGHVVDFIQVYYQTFAWPAFNVADSAICVGAALLAWFSLRSGKDHPRGQ
ncbi:signal peptidase II [Tahibacter amnicola]|uniref:Lipoprotein signal peptidase n=1 Tax=Tahibacter amnicola TaxID=2976241 RepID=A0ABY6BL53_9GAMM|nr:signal peptidase II [Tahibacter amnicola]UXI70733.1 signal peptidase II [Tahibacter amnicola]